MVAIGLSLICLLLEAAQQSEKNLTPLFLSPPRRTPEMHLTVFYQEEASLLEHRLAGSDGLPCCPGLWCMLGCKTIANISIFPASGAKQRQLAHSTVIDMV